MRHHAQFESTMSKWTDRLKNLDVYQLCLRFRIVWRIADLLTQIIACSCKMISSPTNRQRLMIRGRYQALTTALEWQFKSAFSIQHDGYFILDFPATYTEQVANYTLQYSQLIQCDIVLDLIKLNDRCAKFLIPAEIVQLWLNLVDDSLDLTSLMLQFRARMLRGISPYVDTRHLEPPVVATTVESGSQTDLQNDVRYILHQAGMLKQTAVSLAKMQQLVKLISGSVNPTSLSLQENDVNFIIDSSMEELLAPSSRVLQYMSSPEAPKISMLDDQFMEVRPVRPLIIFMIIGYFIEN